MLAMVIIGFIFMRYNKGASDYFKGGNRIPWLVAGLSCFMSSFSAWTFTGAAGIAYRDGIVIVFLYLGNAVTFLLGYFVFAQRWRRTRITTTMAYLVERFDEPTRQTFSVVSVFFQLFIAASVLYGMGLVAASTCGFPIAATIPASGCCSSLLHVRRALGRGGCGFPAGRHPHALLPGAAGRGSSSGSADSPAYTMRFPRKWSPSTSMESTTGRIVTVGR